MNPHLRLLSCLLAAFALLGGCGPKSEEGADPASSAASRDPVEIPEEILQYMQTKVYLGPDVFQDLEAGRITQEEVDERAAAGEFPPLFRFATPDDLPSNLSWENGMDLPDLGSPKAKKGGTLYDYIRDFPRTLRTAGPDASTYFRAYLLDHMALSLGSRHPNSTEITENGFRYYPELAKEWAIDRERKTGYFRLHPEATWSDGVPITANDFLYTLYFFQSEHLQDPWYINYFNRNFANITKYDDHTISISIPEAKPDLTTRLLGFTPLPLHYYGVLDEDFVDTYQWKFAPTTGPYVIHEKDINKGRFIRLTRNKNWWARNNKYLRNRFNFDVIHIGVIREIDKALEAFIKGELDIFSLNLTPHWHDKVPHDHDAVAGGYIHKYTFYNDIPRPSYGIWINMAQPMVADRNLRIGLHYAFNWKKVIEEYSRGDMVRMNSNSEGFGSFVNPRIEAREFNVEKALQHFAEAGFKQRNEKGILVDDQGRELSITLTSPYHTAMDILTILQEEARRAGVEINLDILDLTAGFKKLDEKKHQMVFVGFGTSPEMYPRYFEYYHSTQAYDRAFLADGSVNPDRKTKPDTNNIQSFADPEVDRLIEKYRGSEDVEEMREIAHRIQQIVYNEGSFMPAYVRPFLRVGSWRWIKWPEDFNVRIADRYQTYYLHWMDEEERKATLAARRSGETFPPVIEVFDQYNIYKDTP